MASQGVFGSINQEEEFDLPLGYRFSPNGQEIIVQYLTKKILNQRLPSNIIKDIDLYAYDHPRQLPIGEFKNCKPDEGYFFTQLENRDGKGQPKRTTKSGYWKDTGKVEQIIWNNSIVGFKKILVFYEGKPPTGTRSRWVMHEFRVNPSYLSAFALDITTQTEVVNYVACKIHHKKESGNKRSEAGKKKNLPVRKKTKAC
ncbi:NAC domain-containing protein 83 isoform X1 [Citrus sinensis]|uniref:NAC domain-containing protein n=1 Tax=Citrus sinensis TaxID=2711 RepID=A0A067GSZ9_CITSI|nr:NAC domain-containing protein 83 isoform X1 [Citrus sinensis]KDO81800.1 hypothetical protein CISIN_1g038703mg [Citrus sinensis]